MRALLGWLAAALLLGAVGCTATPIQIPGTEGGAQRDAGPTRADQGISTPKKDLARHGDSWKPAVYLDAALPPGGPDGGSFNKDGDGRLEAGPDGKSDAKSEGLAPKPDAGAGSSGDAKKGG
jgi:hypothetical protein